MYALSLQVQSTSEQDFLFQTSGISFVNMSDFGFLPIHKVDISKAVYFLPEIAKSMVKNNLVVKIYSSEDYSFTADAKLSAFTKTIHIKNQKNIRYFLHREIGRYLDLSLENLFGESFSEINKEVIIDAYNSEYKYFEQYGANLNVQYVSDILSNAFALYCKNKSFTNACPKLGAIVETMLNNLSAMRGMRWFNS